MNYEQANSVKELAAPVNKVLRGLGWKWQPKWGDYFINKFDDSICIFLTDRDEFMDYLLPNGNSQLMHKADFKHYALPILEWETIEGILERAGYYFEEPIKRVYGSEGSKCHCVIKRKGNPKPIGIAWGDSRQEVVMLAVIELGREIKND